MLFRSKGDILQPESILNAVEGQPVDVVWTSNVAYQLADTQNESLDMLRISVERILLSDGIWINADYDSWDSDNSFPSGSYTITASFKRNLDETFVILHAPDDSVDRLTIGGDLDKFIDAISHSRNTSQISLNRNVAIHEMLT